MCRVALIQSALQKTVADACNGESNVEIEPLGAALINLKVIELLQNLNVIELFGN